MGSNIQFYTDRDAFRSLDLGRMDVGPAPNNGFCVLSSFAVNGSQCVPILLHCLIMTCWRCSPAPIGWPSRGSHRGLVVDINLV
jgi:hypothetical protein